MNRDRIRTLFVLGRVSNLPTVWSNCLAAWIIPGGFHSGSPALLLSLVAGCSFLYLGGMYLNDAFDVAFDTIHRPERPIPSGLISRRVVAILGCAWLLVGLLLLAPSGGLWPWALAGLILLYDAVHKRTVWGVPMMAGCRVLIYPMVGVVAITGGPRLLPVSLWMAAGGMGLWVLVLSILARSRSRYAAIVPIMLAGIPIVDLLFVAPASILETLPFLAFTALALLLRRSIPSS